MYRSTLLSDGIEITSKVGDFSPSEMLKSWELLASNFKNFNTRSAEKFVVDAHRFFRLEKKTGFRTDAWNLFSAISDEEYGCACICSTIFVILACRQVGFNDVIVATTYDHIFPSLFFENRGKAFETTELCKTEWISISEMKIILEMDEWDEFYYCETDEKIATLYALNAARELQIPQAENLLLSYPDEENPKFKVARIFTTPEDRIDETLDLFLDWFDMVTGELTVSYAPEGVKLLKFFLRNRKLFTSKEFEILAGIANSLISSMRDPLYLSKLLPVVAEMEDLYEKMVQ